MRSIRTLLLRSVMVLSALSFALVGTPARATDPWGVVYGGGQIWQVTSPQQAYQIGQQLLQQGATAVYVYTWAAWQAEAAATAAATTTATVTTTTAGGTATTGALTGGAAAAGTVTVVAGLIIIGVELGDITWSCYTTVQNGGTVGGFLSQTCSNYFYYWNPYNW